MSNTGRTGIVCDRIFQAHDTGPNHPESADRLIYVEKHLRLSPVWQKCVHVSPKVATREELQKVHQSIYIQRVEESSRMPGARVLDSPDTFIAEASYKTACLAAGSALHLAEQVIEGNIKNGFAIVRPPGHHAEKARAMGFCLFNNVAILARYLQGRGFAKIMILDWDVHHGNGSQNCFYDDPTVFYCSIHQFPFYPGTGAEWETGCGKGEGATLNIPLSSGKSDRDYLKLLDQKFYPACASFEPDFILVSAGFDAHRADPLGGMNLSEDGFYEMTNRVIEIADEFCAGRIISVLEGGYDLKALALCVENHLQALLGNARSR